MYQLKVIHDANFLINTTIAHTQPDAQPHATARAVILTTERRGTKPREQTLSTNQSVNLPRYRDTPAIRSTRYNLVDSRLHGLVTKTSSKPHGAFLRPLGSRFTEVSVPNGTLVSSYVLSTRV